MVDERATGTRLLVCRESSLFDPVLKQVSRPTLALRGVRCDRQLDKGFHRMHETFGSDHPGRMARTRSSEFAARAKGLFERCFDRLVRRRGAGMLSDSFAGGLENSSGVTFATETLTTFSPRIFGGTNFCSGLRQQLDCCPGKLVRAGRNCPVFLQFVGLELACRNLVSSVATLLTTKAVIGTVWLSDVIMATNASAASGFEALPAPMLCCFGKPLPRSKTSSVGATATLTSSC